MVMLLVTPPACPTISWSRFRPMTTSAPAPSPKPLYPLAVGRTVGLVNITGLSYAFLYQSMENFGTDGGEIENLPLMVRCGSFSFGRDQSNLKKPTILSMTPLTNVLTAFSFSVKASLILPRISLTEPGSCP